MGGGCAKVGANQSRLQIVQRGTVDLLTDGNDLFDAFSEVLAGARDGLLHALNKTRFLFFVQAAEKGLNHEVSDNDYRRIGGGDTEARTESLLALGFWPLAKTQELRANSVCLQFRYAWFRR